MGQLFAYHNRIVKSQFRAFRRRGLELRDPWGNRVQPMEYANIQFAKHRAVLEGMGFPDPHKSREATEELARKGMGVKEN